MRACSLTLSVVDNLDTASGHGKTDGRLGESDLILRTENYGLADLTVDACARGGNDTRIHTFGKNDRAVQLRSVFDNLVDCVHLIQFKV